ncbi:hypothetical protein CIG75_09255 [Tumebacillus algifaecis]|uniref:DUF6884 domain-containing protein n=1 Tax=Tumebacillus algifaecis TaxID=1214604 RepID=A0A223D073_9BACL|nr:DUF6884 domain-containing protein [Tumebacillus algifaecis]ASS75149.1 hypothetical protein CIG75_09255 [Tumebacillus algifaecis]
MKRLCIIPCGSRKIWDQHPDFAGPAEAQHTYTGTLHKLCQAYAKKFFGDDWLILSAKHGLLRPEDIVSENYDVRFTSNNPLRHVSLQAFMRQVEEKGLTAYDDITILGGKKYTLIVPAIFGNTRTYHMPLQGCKGIGFMLQRLKRALAEGKELADDN